MQSQRPFFTPTPLVLAAAALLFAADPARGQCDVTFGAGVDIATGSLPSGLALADFNRDGRLDIALTNRSSNTLSVLLGNGAGGFGAAINTSISNPRALAVGDFNRDGQPDLAVCNFAFGTITALLGNGAGGFTAGAVVATGNGPRDLTTADFNRDGRADLAVVNQNSMTLSILIGNGAGGFSPAVNLAAPGSPQSVAVGDFNRDGQPDLAVGDGLAANSRVLVYLGLGGTSFSPATSYSTPGGPRDLVIGDLNGDNRIDILTGNSSAGIFTCQLAGNGDGTFQPSVNTTRSAFTFAVALADFNGDGRSDVARVGSSFSALVNPSFPSPSGALVETASSALGGTTESAAAGDFNGDGRPDVVATIPLSNVITVFLNSTGDGTSLPTISGPTSLSVLSGDPAVFTITAAPSNPGQTYRWRRNGVNITGSGLPGGAMAAGFTTGQLTITSTSLALNASVFDCVVTDACGDVVSRAAALCVANRCRADFNSSGTVSVQDIFDFLAAYFAGCP